MTEDEFWAIVDAVNTGSGGDCYAKEELLKERLEKLDDKAVLAFNKYLDIKMGEAYSWPLSAAAHIIHDGCSDDGFMDFSSCVIFLGREVFDAAVENPDSLAALDDETLQETWHEGLLYVPRIVYEAKTGSCPEYPDSDELGPADRAGEYCEKDDEAALSALCPKLWKRFGK